MSDESRTCINCGATISDAFCGTCGQPKNPPRLNWKTLWGELIDRLYSLDSRFLRTLVQLTTHPGKVAKQFIDGNRVLYVPPLSYFLITITLYILFLGLIGVTVYDTIQDAQNTVNTGEMGVRQQKVQMFFTQQISEYMRTFSFIQIPFVAMATMIFFRKDRFTFVEHCVLALYAHGHLTLLGLGHGILIKYGYSFGTMIIPFLSMVYFGYACSQFYSTKKVAGFIKGFLSHILSTIFFMIFISLVTMVGFLLYIKFVDPEFIDKL